MSTAARRLGLLFAHLALILDALGRTLDRRAQLAADYDRRHPRP